jgi:hypothetical protein
VDLNFNLDKSDGEAERRAGAAGVKAQVEGRGAGGKAHVEGAVLAARRTLKSQRWALGGGKAQVEVAAVGAWLRQGAG